MCDVRSCFFFGDFGCFILTPPPVRNGILARVHTHTKYREESIAAALKDGVEQLQMLRRQATISQLYPSGRSVMESEKKK